MANKQKRYWFIIGMAAFLAYVFAAARPIPEETVLSARWLSSLESSLPVSLGGTSGDPDILIPFQLGGRFGYIRDDGSFSINQVQKNYLSLSEDYWSEYETLPSSLEIQDPLNRNVLHIEKPEGYPFFLDGKFFLIGKGQDTLIALDERGAKLWSYEFPAPLTCIDAASGFVLAGTLDGTVELLNSEGRQLIPPFEPGGSRLAVIMGCAISKNATRLALVSGIDDQRFLLLEQSGNRFRVVYHEFLSTGYRRPVHIFFIENDSRIVFEREGGLGIYDIASRTSVKIPLEGGISALDTNGSDGIFFAVTSSSPEKKRLVGIRYPNTTIMEAPFRSVSSFLSRRNSRLYLGGDMGIVSLELEEK